MIQITIQLLKQQKQLTILILISVTANHSQTVFIAAYTPTEYIRKRGRVNYA
jgi:hypothetical protein